MISVLSTLSSSTAAVFLAYATSTTAERSVAQHLIDVTEADVFHLDLHSRGARVGSSKGEQEPVETPWFSGFDGTGLEAGVSAAAATVSHPIRRILSYLREEEVELEEALTWTEGQGRSSTVALPVFMVVFRTRKVLYKLYRSRTLVPRTVRRGRWRRRRRLESGRE